MQLSNFLLLMIFITTTLMCFSILNQNSTIKLLQRSLLNKSSNNKIPSIILKEYIGKECELICPSISLIGQKGILEEIDGEWVKMRFKKGKGSYKTQIVHILSIESIITD